MRPRLSTVAPAPFSMSTASSDMIAMPIPSSTSKEELKISSIWSVDSVENCSDALARMFVLMIRLLARDDVTPIVA